MAVKKGCGGLGTTVLVLASLVAQASSFGDMEAVLPMAAASATAVLVLVARTVKGAGNPAAVGDWMASLESLEYSIALLLGRCFEVGLPLLDVASIDGGVSIVEVSIFGAPLLTVFAVETSPTEPSPMAPAVIFKRGCGGLGLTAVRAPVSSTAALVGSTARVWVGACRGVD